MFAVDAPSPAGMTGTVCVAAAAAAATAADAMAAPESSAGLTVVVAATGAPRADPVREAMKGKSTSSLNMRELWECAAQEQKTG